MAPGSICTVTPRLLPLSLSFPVLFLFKSEPSSFNSVYPLAIFRLCWLYSQCTRQLHIDALCENFEVNATKIKIIIKMYHSSVWYRNWHRNRHRNRHRHTNAHIKQWDAVLSLFCVTMRKFKCNVIVYRDKCSK